MSDFSVTAAERSQLIALCARLEGPPIMDNDYARGMNWGGKLACLCVRDILGEHLSDEENAVVFDHHKDSHP